MLQYSPKIVTDSLVMCLDASNNKSYPTDLPVKNGLVMWMDAADDTTFSYSSGTTVSQWRDKSGFNNHMVPISAGPTRSSVLNSRKVLAFTIAQTIGSLTFTLETSAYTVFAITRYTTSPTNTNRVLTAYYNNWLLGNWGGQVTPYFAEGWVYYPSSAADNIWRIYMGDWGGSSNDIAAAYSNGTVLASGSAAATAGPKGLGINYQGGEVSASEVAEIVVFNRLLSITERRLVHTYLGQKWGISNTDRSVFDLAGNNTLLFGTGNVSYMPYFDFYNKGALKFDGSNDFAGVASTTTYGTNTTWEAWVNRSVSANEFNMFMGAYLPYFGLRADGSIIFSNTINSVQQTLYSTGFTSSNDTWYYLSFTTDYNGTNTTARIYINGVLNNSATFTGAQTTSNEYFGIGDGRGSSSWYPFNGKVSNVKVYNRTLSATEIFQNYETQKSKFANTIVQQGLVLNLDAGNPYSYAGAGSAWYDVSGNTKDFILDGSGITYNSGGYFNLADGGATRTATITNSITCTVVVWIRTTDTQALIFRGNNLNTHYLAAYNPSAAFYSANCGSPTYWIDTISISNPNPTYLDGNWHMWEMKNVNFSSWTSYEFNKYSGFTFGNGAVGQIMIYDRNLSSAESLQIYNATKGRFGLL